MAVFLQISNIISNKLNYKSTEKLLCVFYSIPIDSAHDSSWLAVPLNPLLPSIATALLVYLAEAAVRQLQKTDTLNPKGYNLSCKAHSFQL